MINGLLFIILMIIVIGLFAYVLDKAIGHKEYSWHLGSERIFSSLLAVFLVAMFISYFLYDMSVDSYNYKTIETKEILSLSSQVVNNVNAEYKSNILFSYGRGISNNKVYYRVIVGNNFDGFKMMDLDANKTTLFFIEKSENPKVIINTNNLGMKSKENWLFGRVIKVNNKVQKYITDVEYDIYIPKEAVIIEYNTEN